MFSPADLSAAVTDRHAAQLARILSAAHAARIDRWHVGTAWAGAALLGCRSAADLARALCVPPSTARTAWRAYRAAALAVGDSDPPLPALSAEQDRPPASETRGGEGGGLPFESLPHSSERDSETQRRNDGAAFGRPVSMQRGASRASRTPAHGRIPEQAEKAAAAQLRRLGLAEHDVRGCMGWLTVQWAERGGGVLYPVAWAASVVLRRAHEMGLRAQSADARSAEALAGLRAMQGLPAGAPPAPRAASSRRAP